MSFKVEGEFPGLSHHSDNTDFDKAAVIKEAFKGIGRHLTAFKGDWVPS